MMPLRGATTRRQAALPLAVLAALLCAGLLVLGVSADPQLALAIYGVLLTLAATLALGHARAAEPVPLSPWTGSPGLLEPPRLRASDPGLPGHVWPRAPGRSPR